MRELFNEEIIKDVKKRKFKEHCLQKNESLQEQKKAKKDIEAIRKESEKRGHFSKLIESRRNEEEDNNLRE